MIKAERSCSTGQHLLTHMKRSNNMICCQVVGDTPRSIGLIDALEQERHWHSHIFVARSNFLSQSSFHHSVVHLTNFFFLPNNDARNIRRKPTDCRDTDFVKMCEMATTQFSPSKFDFSIFIHIRGEY